MQKNKIAIETSSGPIFLIGLYVASEIIANITASKPVSLGAGIVVPAAVFIYALTFTLIDLINEQLGKEGARKVVYTAFAANLLLAAYIQFAIHFPSPSFYKGSAAFSATLGSTWRIVAASLAAYLVSSLVDTEIFAWLHDPAPSGWRRWAARHKWARVLGSNTISTLVDSATFITLAFWGVLPVWPLIKGQYLVKMAVTVVSIPLIYLIHGNYTLYNEALPGNQEIA